MRGVAGVTRKSPTFPDLVCKACGQTAPRVGPMQKYCRPCSERRDLERKSKWARENGKPRARKERPLIIERGKELSAGEKLSIAHIPAQPDLLWLARIAIPFSWAASKNHIYALRAKGHVFLRQEGKGYRQQISLMVKSAVRDLPVVQNKVWLDILVQKPNHRGDATNFVDLICDAVKDGLGVDDRWFSIRRLDWQIVKNDPQIYIGIGQDADAHAQPCSSCGRIQPLTEFHKSRSNKMGVGRNCRDCSSARRKVAA